jgi:plastocyanin
MAAATSVALVLSACGGDGSGSDRADAAPAADASTPSGAVAGGSEVQVVAKDIAFEPAEVSIGAAPTKIVLKNDGAIPHSLVIDGAPNAKKLEVASTGESDSAMFDLAPGTYTAYCDQPGHRAAGMETKLIVG